MTSREATHDDDGRRASPRALLERCPCCGRKQALTPVHGRRGGELLCLDCVVDRRRAPRLFDDEQGGER